MDTYLLDALLDPDVEEPRCPLLTEGEARALMVLLARLDDDSEGEVRDAAGELRFRIGSRLPG
ncbi:hypothetical protein [Streptomyces sp. NPDC089799]|uniref:hypothetical protein n=1 Tax=Streptomyces sp. NPDC089799 TaxID=3155066 RepID=UPI0034427C71